LVTLVILLKFRVSEKNHTALERSVCYAHGYIVQCPKYYVRTAYATPSFQIDPYYFQLTDAFGQAFQIIIQSNLYIKIKTFLNWSKCWIKRTILKLIIV